MFKTWRFARLLIGRGCWRFFFVSRSLWGGWQEKLWGRGGGENVDHLMSPGCAPDSSLCITLIPCPHPRTQLPTISLLSVPTSTSVFPLSGWGIGYFRFVHQFLDSKSRGICKSFQKKIQKEKKREGIGWRSWKRFKEQIGPIWTFGIVPSWEWLSSWQGCKYRRGWKQLEMTCCCIAGRLCLMCVVSILRKWWLDVCQKCRPTWNSCGAFHLAFLMFKF